MEAVLWFLLNLVVNLVPLTGGTSKVLLCSLYIILDTRFSLCLSTLTVPPLDSETGGMESSGQRLISLNSKTKRISYFLFFARKDVFLNVFSWKKRKKIGFLRCYLLWFFFIFCDFVIFLFFFMIFLVCCKRFKVKTVHKNGLKLGKRAKKKLWLSIRQKKSRLKPSAVLTEAPLMSQKSTRIEGHTF